MIVGTDRIQTCLFWNCLDDYDITRRGQIFNSSPSTKNGKIIQNLADSVHKGILERQMVFVPETNDSELDIGYTIKSWEILSD